MIWYTIYINGEPVFTLNSKSATFTCAAVLVPTGCTPLNQETTYAVTVRARDVDGNLSAVSDPVFVTTDPADPNDHTPPTPLRRRRDNKVGWRRWWYAIPDLGRQDRRTGRNREHQNRDCREQRRERSRHVNSCLRARRGQKRAFARVKCRTRLRGVWRSTLGLVQRARAPQTVRRTRKRRATLLGRRAHEDLRGHGDLKAGPSGLFSSVNGLLKRTNSPC